MEKKKEKGWDDYLSKEEEIISEYSLGGYDILATNRRLIFLKKFPKSFSEARYEDIHSLNHNIPFNWKRFSKAIISLIVAGYLYSIMSKIPEKLPGLSFLPVDETVNLIVVLVFAYGIYNLLKFLLSTRGILKITLREKSPIKIQTSLTPEVKDMIKTIEGLKVAKKKPAQPAPQPTGEKPKPPEVKVAEVPEVKGIEEIYDKVKSSMEGLDDNAIVLVSVKSEDHMAVVPSILRLLLEDKKQSGVYIGVSSPYEQIMKVMNKNDIPSDNLVLVDCISHMAGKVPEEKGNVVFIENPYSLEEIGMYSDKLLMRMPAPKFVFIDSLSSLLIYNKNNAVREFIHFMINKMRLDNLGGIILTTEKKEAEELVKTLVPMCDKLVKV